MYSLHWESTQPTIPKHWSMTDMYKPDHACILNIKFQIQPPNIMIYVYHMRGYPRKSSDNTCPYWLIISHIFSGILQTYKRNWNTFFKETDKFIEVYLIYIKLLILKSSLWKYNIYYSVGIASNSQQNWKTIKYLC